jgi:Arc/MetJ-type ribon-helix-helix transcriptional regulator
MNSKTIPVQIRLPLECINKIDTFVKEGKYSSRADFIRQKTVQAIEYKDLQLSIDEICANILQGDGKANGMLQRQVRTIVKQILVESLKD